MKKCFNNIIAGLLSCAILLCAVFISGCKSGGADDDKIKILCTVFPVYDWVTNIVGDSDAVEVSLLVESGTDMHSFQPSFADMVKIKDSDVVVYIGGESDAWVAESVEDSATSVRLSALEGITLYEVSADSLAKAHTHVYGEDCHDHSDGFDEHLWLSVRNAIAVCRKICDTLCELDGQNAESYRENTASYTDRLQGLDGRLSALGKSISQPLVFADRFPFVYMLEDHGIDYFAAFEGCTAEADADFDTTIKLAKKLDEIGGKYLFVTESPIEKDLADSVIAETQSKSAQVVTLDSMQSLTREDIDGGADYVFLMEKNISELEKIFKVAEE